jgi:hypothetical protein
MFGWLEVDEILSVVTNREVLLGRYPWIKSHPHVVAPSHYDNPLNTLYVAASKSRYTEATSFGGGFFPHYRDVLQLTSPDAKGRSTWMLPEWFMPGSDRPALSYHDKTGRWTLTEGGVELKSAAKGQEFVLDANYYPDAEIWMRDLIGSSAR